MALLIGYPALLGIAVHYSCRAVRLQRLQRLGRPSTNIRLQVFHPPPTTPSDGRAHPSPLPFCAFCFIPRPSTPFQSFDEEAQEAHTVNGRFQTYPQTDTRPRRNRFNLTIRTDGLATPRATYLILSPLEAGQSEIGSLERGRDIEMKSIGGFTRGEADRRFVAGSSPKKHIRIGRGRDLA